LSIPQLQVCLFLQTTMKILLTGKYDPTYNRTQIITNGLKSRSDIEVIEMPYADKTPSVEQMQSADFIFLPAFTHADVVGIKKRSSTPLVFDPLISKYLTKVFDYKQVSKWSPRAYKNYLKDKTSMHAADIVLADTQAHAEYFAQKFKLNPDKIAVLPIGVDTNDFVPSNKSSDSIFKIGFYGGFIPLQGTEVIVQAAKLLEKHNDISFQLIGDGFEYQKIQKLCHKLRLTNLSLLGWVESSRLNEKLDSFDLCLGIFGSSKKSDIVIPNKLFHYAAKNICFVTKESRAVSEIFTNNTSCVLCKNTAEHLAQKILELKEDSVSRSNMAAAAYKLVTTDYNQDKIAEKFIGILRQFESS
jgi:glycosyltransferase involved in cell wall biosynthesis